MRGKQRLALAAALTLVTAAFVTSCSARRAESAVGSPNLISEDEIRSNIQSGVRDARELIQRIRPRWLQTRGERSINLQTEILVYHNQQPIGGPDSLRDFQLSNIRSIRYLDSAQAGSLPGTSGRHVEAAIVISTAR
jgi:hypothetical protein